MKRRLTLITLIFLLTIFLRIHDVGRDFSFHAEYNYKLWAIANIVYNHKTPLIGIEAVSYLHHVHYPPLALYMFAPILFVSGGNPLSIENALIFLNGVNAVLLYLLVEKIWSKRPATFASLMYATSFFIQNIDRYIWVVGVLPTVMLSYLLVFAQVFKNQDRPHFKFFILGLLTGIGLNFHYQAMVFAICAIIIALRLKTSKRKNIAHFLLGLIIPLSPLILFEFRHNFYNLQGMFLLLGDIQSNNSGSLLSRILLTIVTLGEFPLKIITGASYPYHYPKLISISSFSIQIVFIFWLLKHLKKAPAFKKQFISLLIILWLLGLTTYPFVQNRHYSVFYYLFYLTPVLVIALSSLANFFCKRLAVIAIPILGIWLVFQIMSNVKSISSHSWNNQLAAISYLINNAPKRDFEIRFIGVSSEEYDYLIYYVSRKLSYPYSNIHYLEPWHTKKSSDFTLSLGQSLDKSENFGPISVRKNVP